MHENISLNQHAYIITEEIGGDIAGVVQDAVESVFGTKIKSNPDFHLEKYEIFGIDESRSLKEEQSRRALSGDKKIFIIKADGITREAQNALLKVFEEPTEGTYIFLIVPNLRVILPTLRSRARVIETESKKNKAGVSEETERFISTIPPLRLKFPFVKKIIEEKDKGGAEAFLNNLELVLHTRKEISPQLFHELFKMRGYIHDRSASVKMIMEHISLAVPVIN